MGIDKRKEEILKKVVEEYISTGQPVGSERIVDRLSFPLSSATARSEMFELEKMGYLFQPYTSAGRVPTSKGYRFSIESILKDNKQKNLKQIRLPAPEKLNDLRVTLDEVANLISSYTKEISLVFSPSGEDVRIRYVHLFTINPGSVYLVLITNTQTSEAVSMGDVNLSEDVLRRIENLVNEKLSNIPIKTAIEIMKRENYFEGEVKEGKEVLHFLDIYLKKELEQGEKREIYIKGISNLLSTRISIAEQKIKSLLYMLEEKKTISNIVEKITEKERLGFSIGEENVLPELSDYSLIAVKYTVKEMEGHLALLGPTRMDYLKGIFVLDKIADKLEDIVSKIIG